MLDEKSQSYEIRKGLFKSLMWTVLKCEIDQVNCVIVQIFMEIRSIHLVVSETWSLGNIFYIAGAELVSYRRIFQTRAPKDPNFLGQSFPFFAVFFCLEFGIFLNPSWFWIKENIFFNKGPCLNWYILFFVFCSFEENIHLMEGSQRYHILQRTCDSLQLLDRYFG